MAPIITTERLTLSALSVDDAEHMVAVLASPSLYEFTGGEAPSLESLRQRYRSQVAGSGDPAEEWRNWIVRRTDSGRAVGFIQADITSAGAELAWVIGLEDQGQGFASEAAIAVRDALREEDVAPFLASIHPAHGASQAVARRLGLERTGVVDDDGEEQWSSSGDLVAASAFVLRPRTDADLPELVAVAAAVQSLDGYPAFLPGGDFERFLTEPTSQAAWVAVSDDAVSDDAVVGHVVLNDKTSEPVMELVAELGIDPPPIYVARLLVKPSARRLGIGRGLLGVAADEARRLGRTPMLDVLDIDKAAPAMALYRSNGWRDVGRVSFDLGGASVTEIVFVGPPA